MNNVPCIAEKAITSISTNDTGTIRSPTFMNIGRTPPTSLLFVKQILTVHSLTGRSSEHLLDGSADLLTKCVTSPVSNKIFIGEWSFLSIH